MKNIIKKKKPCAECPYKMGLVKTLINPCPDCRQNNYRTFEEFTKRNRSGQTGTDNGEPVEPIDDVQNKND